MKINKRYLILRILTFPIKLTFNILWNILMAFILTYNWILLGSQELYYGKDGKDSLVKLIEQNEKIIEDFKL